MKTSLLTVATEAFENDSQFKYLENMNKNTNLKENKCRKCLFLFS